MLLWMCWFCTVQGMLVNGLVPSAITSIERRFQFNSSTIGRIMQVKIIKYLFLTAIFPHYSFNNDSFLRSL